MGLIGAMHGLLWAAQGGVREYAMPGLQLPETHACTAQFNFSKNRDDHRLHDGSPLTAGCWGRAPKNILAGRAAVRFHSGSCDSWNCLARQVARVHATGGHPESSRRPAHACSKLAFCRSPGCRRYPPHCRRPIATPWPNLRDSRALFRRSPRTLGSTNS
jgi:hypothetical protein